MFKEIIPDECNKEGANFLKRHGWVEKLDDPEFVEMDKIWTHPNIYDGQEAVDMAAALDIERMLAAKKPVDNFERIAEALETISDTLGDIDYKLDNIAGCLVDLNK